jgi:cytochrome o ubiquinol oxidase operon protein cyoD
VLGFFLSLAITFIAFFLATYHIANDHTAISHQSLVAMILLLALGQFIVQSYFFFHLGQDRSKRFELIIFICTSLCVAIIVIGSLWIMNNLNYHMMQNPEIENQLLEDEMPHHHKSQHDH